MFNTSLKPSSILLASVLFAAGQVFAADQAQMRKADGLTVYYGVMPAEMIAGHEKEHGGAQTRHGELRVSPSVSGRSGQPIVEMP